MRRGPLSSRVLGQRRARVGAFVLALIALVAIFAEWIASDWPLYMSYDGESHWLPAITRPPGVLQRATESVAAIGSHDLVIWLLFRNGPSTVTKSPPLSGPTARHPLGIDAFGRDVFARLVYGTRTALAVGAGVALLALLAGYAMGSLAGALGGLWDSLLERGVEVVGVFPAVIAVALVRAVEKRPSLLSLVLVITLVKWAEIARLTRVLVMRSMAEPWAMAARGMGASPLRVSIRHLAPHVVPSLVSAALLAVASVVLTETSLSFLELGVPSSSASWGEMLGEVRWGAGAGIWLPPTLALIVTLISLHWISDAIRASFDDTVGPSPLRDSEPRG